MSVLLDQVADLLNGLDLSSLFRWYNGSLFVNFYSFPQVPDCTHCYKTIFFEMGPIQPFALILVNIIASRKIKGSIQKAGAILRIGKESRYEKIIYRISCDFIGHAGIC
jgi:hypothetical protein